MDSKHPKDGVIRSWSVF